MRQLRLGWLRSTLLLCFIANRLSVMLIQGVMNYDNTSVRSTDDFVLGLSYFEVDRNYQLVLVVGHSPTMDTIYNSNCACIDRCRYTPLTEKVMR